MEEEFQAQLELQKKDHELRTRAIALGEARTFHEGTAGADTEAVVATAKAFYEFLKGE